MKQIMEHYGKFALDAMIVIVLMTVIFISLEDRKGNKGIYAVIGAQMDINSTNYHTYIDFKETYKKESEKSAPRVSFKGDRLVVGVHRLSQYIEAVDYAGNHLAIKVTSIKAPDGTEVLGTYNQDTTEINISQLGIYKVSLSAIDDCNKTTKVTIQIPVNKY